MTGYLRTLRSFAFSGALSMTLGVTLSVTLGVTPVLTIALAVAVPADSAFAASGKGSSRSNGDSKTYRWVDKDGVVHFGDHVPPEYSASKRQVLNDFGVPVGVEEGAKSAEQIAAEKAATKKAEAERQKQILAARRDQVLLDTYLSVDEIEALRDRRLELIDTQIKVTENYLQGLRNILNKLQAEAASFKPYSSDPKAPPIDERLAKELSDTMDSIILYEKNLSATRARKADVIGRFASDITRFRELKAAIPVEDE